MPSPWKIHFWHNLLSGYVLAAIRIVSGILVFPLLFRNMQREEFGFWSLLWGVIGYTVLMDFGMGTTARLEVARRRVHDDWDGLSRLLSTTFWSYVVLFSVVEAGLIALRPAIFEAIHVSPEHVDEFASAYLYFSLVVALGFPLGLFGEVLRGLQRQDLYNILTAGGRVLNVVALFIGIQAHSSFATLMTLSVVCTMAPFVGCLLAVRRLAPRISIHPMLFDLREIWQVLDFSLIAYALTIANLVIARSDQIVISASLGVASVATYQIGFKLSEIFGQAASQVGLNLSQAAAHCRSARQDKDLVDLSAKSTALTALVAIPAFAFALVYIDPIVHFLTGLSSVSQPVRLVAVLLLVAQLSHLLTHTCACPIFLGAGLERGLLAFTLVEAVANLVLSVLLVGPFGMVGVAIGTLVPAVVVGWLVAFPITLRLSRCAPLEFVRRVHAPIATPVAASLALLAGAATLAPPSSSVGIGNLLLVSAVVVSPAILYLSRHVRSGFWSQAEVSAAAPPDVDAA